MPMRWIYVSAGATAPPDIWLDALREGGRLVLPLAPAEGVGGTLLIVSRGRTGAGGQVSAVPCAR
jgi:protein-L-isoaspartate O-methyltransferase